jgi:PAS domain S-box-containing protein
LSFQQVEVQMKHSEIQRTPGSARARADEVEPYVMEATDERAAAEQSRSALRHYRDLFELAPDGYVVTSPGGIIQELNPAACTLFGASEQFAVGRLLINFLSLDEGPAFQAELDRLLTTGVPQQWALRLRPSVGAAVNIAVSVKIAHDEQTRAVALHWLFKDITALERVFEGLAAAYADLVDNALEAIFQITPDGYVRRVNKAAAELLGHAFPQDVFAGHHRHLRDLYDNDELVTLTRVISRGLITNYDFDAFLRGKYGSVHARVRARAVNDVHGEVVGVNLLAMRLPTKSDSSPAQH